MSEFSDNQYEERTPCARGRRGGLGGVSKGSCTVLKLGLNLSAKWLG